MSSRAKLNVKLRKENLSDCEADNWEDFPITKVLDRHVALTISITSEGPTFGGIEFVKQNIRFDI